MPLGGGGIGGGGYSGGPAIVPTSDLMIQSMDPDLLVLDLMRQDLTTVAPGATASDIVANFDGGISSSGTTSIDLGALLSTSSLDTLSSLYDAAMANQTSAMEYYLFITSVTSASWAAWDSGPSSDIMNMMAAQQQAREYSFQEFMAESSVAMNAMRQQESIATSYLVDRAGALVDTNPGLSFRDALSFVANAVASNPSDLIAYAQAMVGNIETVVVTGTYDPYADYVFTYGTADGGGGEATGRGTMSANVMDHTLHTEEMQDTTRLAKLLHDIVDVHHGVADTTETKTDMNGKTATLTEYLVGDHIVGTLNVYVVTESDSNGLAINNVYFDTREQMNQFLQDK